MSADAMACISAAVRPVRTFMPPTLPLIAFCSLTTVTPVLLEEASAPWHRAQFAAYKAAPSAADDTGGGVVVPPGVVAGADMMASLMLWMSAADMLESAPMPPRFEAMALCMAATLARPFRFELALAPWQPAHLEV